MDKEMEFGWLNDYTNKKKIFQTNVNPSIKRAISDALKHKFDISDYELKLLFPSKNASGSYRLFTKTDDYFIRVTSRIGDYSLEKSLIHHLNKDNVSINDILIGGVQLNWQDNLYRIDVRPFIEGNHYSNSEIELESLLIEMQIFHNSIGNFSYEKTVKDNQRNISNNQINLIKLIRDAIHIQDYDRFKEYSSWVHLHQDWLENILSHYDPMFYKMPNAQCIHGQVHPGNVMFIKNKATIFDLETSIMTYAPKCWDYSWILQRFCLDYNLEKKELSKKVRLIVKYSNEKLSSLLKMARIISVNNVLSVFDYRINQDTIVPQSELEKFHNHELKVKNIENAYK
jgi:hypothetical protein